MSKFLKYVCYLGEHFIMRESLQDLALNTKSSNSNLPSVSQTPCQQPFNCFNGLLIACILHLTTQKSSRCWKGDRQSLISGPRMKLGWLFSMFLRDNCSCSSLATHYHLAVHLLWFPAILKTNYYFLCVCVSVWVSVTMRETLLLPGEVWWVWMELEECWRALSLLG